MRGKTGPFVMSLALGELGLLEVALRLPKPVLGSVGHWMLVVPASGAPPDAGT